MKLIVGLGNPGEKYDGTRHNIGFVILDKIAQQLCLEFSKSEPFNCLYAKSNNCELIKPQTFMNDSGSAVAKIMQKHELVLTDLIVIHDDTEIPFGQVRVKRGGTSGGHNGIKSIDEAIGDNYYRVRVGVGRPENRDFELSDYVLARFSLDEQKELPGIIDRVASYLLESISKDNLEAITFNAKETN